MARQSRYADDTDVGRQDKLSGTDSVTDATRNFPLVSILQFLIGSDGVGMDLPTTDPGDGRSLWVDANGFLKRSIST